MKILHTSDWHIGHILYNNERYDEHEAFFASLARIVKNEQPDAMIVSGDVFHYSSPSVRAQQLFVDGLYSVCCACTSMKVYVIAGNHDSGMRIEVTKQLWQSHNVSIVGCVRQDEKGKIISSPHIFDCDGKAYIVCVPYFSSRWVAPRELFAALNEELLRINIGHQPVVVAAHLSVADTDDDMSLELVGGLEYVPIADLGIHCDYLALGHIHKPRSFSNNKGRYCGSPIPISFDEDYPHGVDIVEIVPNAEPCIKTIVIDNPKKLLTIPSEPAPLDDALGVLAALPDHVDAYIRFNVLVDNYLPPDANQRASDVLLSKKSSLCLIRTEIKRDESDNNDVFKPMTVSEFRELTPFDVAMRAYQKMFNSCMDEELQDMLKEAIEAAEHKDH